MYAVIKSGGKQYKVREGDTIRVEKINTEEGGEINLDDVLMVADGDDISFGTPVVDGATVAATVKSHGRGAKIKVVKFKRRKHHYKQMGHRQDYTELEITGINTQ
ncbi:MAG: 50S ribosomal protein L21 [Gammaproteobacteria bacterium]|nr:50S ribosomal protein L21 [Gammaproteobacteria bacterium]